MEDGLAGREGAVLSGGFANPVSECDAGDGYSYLPWVDCITAGVPCQDVSVAGKRAGLKGERTGLFYEFARILRELRPDWFVFENVPGLLSSNDGRDFAEVLRVLMVECGYGVSWRVLDSRYFNVAQRRERVFIVGRFGKPCPAAVLFEPESRQGNPAPGREAGQDIAAPLTSGSGGTGNPPGRRREDDFNLAVIQDVRGGTRDKTDHGQGIGIRGDGPCYTLGATEQHGVAYALSASAGHHGHSSPRGDGSDNIVLGREPDHGHAGLFHAGEGADDARETAFSLRVDPSGTGQGWNTNYAIAIRTAQTSANGHGLSADKTHTLDGAEGQCVAYPEHKEQSRQQFNAALEMDGTVQRNADDGSPSDSTRMRDAARQSVACVCGGGSSGRSSREREVSP